jgi:sugar phosphate isomerase/epimerase
LGGFVEVLALDPAGWEQRLTFMRSLERLDHVEAWLEWLPSRRAEVAMLRETLGDLPVLIHAPFVGVSLVAPGSETRKAAVDRLLRTCEVAQELGATVVTAHCGQALFCEDRQRIYDWLATAFSTLLRELDNTALAVENMNCSRGVTQEPVVDGRDVVRF